MIAQTLRIVYWFNPLVWIVCRRLRLESECACDDAVLSGDIAGHEYAGHLLDLARSLNRRGGAWSAALTMARPSTIERRFSAMLNPSLSRYPVSRLALCATVVVGLSLTLLLVGAAKATPAAPQEQVVQPPAVLVPTIQVPAVPVPAGSAEAVKARRVAVQAAIVAALPEPSQLRPVLPVEQPQQIRRRTRALDRALFEAAEEGDVSEVEDLVRAGANVNAVLAGDGTPLIGAAREGRLDIVRFLLDRGADPNVPSPGDGNPLIVAAREGYIAVVRLLLDRGADLSAAVRGDGNPLIAAASSGHTDIAALLLDHGANIEQVVPGDENALIQASEAGHLNMVQLLVNRGANVNARVWVDADRWRPNGEWRTPLTMARKGGHQAVIQFLLAAGARD